MRYVTQVALRLLDDLGLYQQRLAVASKIVGRPVRDLNDLTDKETHALCRALRMRKLVP